MKVEKLNDDITLYCGDCLEIMSGLPENSVDTIITDPPYGLTFMGKDWDKGVPGVHFWQEALRVAKPGAILLAFGGTRTYHRMVCAIEDAGFEIRDMVEWLYGSGFPKSYNIGKGIDKQAGATGEVIGKEMVDVGMQSGNMHAGRKSVIVERDITAPATPEAQLWDGWGTALKPAHEPIVVAMKPIDGSFVNNALTWGVAGLWIDGGRVGCETITQHGRNETFSQSMSGKNYAQEAGTNEHQGRFPANLILDGSDEVVSGFPQCKAGIARNTLRKDSYNNSSYSITGQTPDIGYGDSGSAARFFMTCKQDDLCSLCLTPKHSIMSNIDNSEVIQCKSLFANNVEKSLTATQATTLNIAQESVQDWLIEKAVHFAKSAGNLCEKCATSIVREVVEIKTWDFKNVVSPVIQDFIGNSNKCILIQNLAQYAEIWDSIDTTPTTTSLLTLFGYARRVITNYIQETEKTAPKRFLYSPKASRSERNAGLESVSGKPVAWSNQAKAELKRGNLEFSDGDRKHNKVEVMQNHHPTVKPIELMRYLVRLTKTPTGGTVLDPFMGSGTTGCACALDGRKFMGIEIDESYFDMSCRRIQKFLMQPRLL